MRNKFLIGLVAIVIVAGCVNQDGQPQSGRSSSEETTSTIQTSAATVSVVLPQKLTASTYKIAEGYIGLFKGTAKQYFSVVKQISQEELPGACLWEVNTGSTYIDMSNNKIGELTHGWHYYYTTGSKGLLISVSKKLDSPDIIATLTPDTTILPVSGAEEKHFTPAQTSDCIDFDLFVDHTAAGKAALKSTDYFSASYSFRAAKISESELWELKSSKPRSPGAGIATIFVDGKIGGLAK